MRVSRSVRSTFSILFAVACVVVYPACSGAEPEDEDPFFDVVPESATLSVGESLELELETNITSDPASELTWESSDLSVVTIDRLETENTRAVINAVGEGMATVTVTLVEGVGIELESATSVITVVEGPVEASITPAEATVPVGGTVSFTATGPATADNVEWTTDTPGVATVAAGSPSTTATVTGVSPGMATITVSFFLGEELQSEAMATVTVEQGGGGGEVVEGIWPLGVSGVEAVISFNECGDATITFGTLSLSCGVVFAHDDGFGVFDFASQSTVYQQTGLSATIGATFSAAPVQNGGDAAFILAGAQGDGLADTEGLLSLASGPTAFDAFPAGGDYTSGWVSTAGPGRGICTYGPDNGSVFGFAQLRCFEASVFTGELVSSYPLRGGLDSPAFYLTRDVQSSVYFFDGSSPVFASPAFQVGLDARSFTCAGDGAGNYLCGITIFGTDQISVVTYSDGGTPALVGSIDVADGPVDLDMKYRSDGTYDLITGGFNDNRMVYINLNPNGTVNIRNFEDAPSGCSGLGHITFLGDEDDAPIAGTCFNSGDIFLEFSVE